MYVLKRILSLLSIIFYFYYFIFFSQNFISFQYTLLQTVVDACQKKRHCKFSANSKPLANGDPCAGIRKFVEIAYKCRPCKYPYRVLCFHQTMNIFFIYDMSVDNIWLKRWYYLLFVLFEI